MKQKSVRHKIYKALEANGAFDNFKKEYQNYLIKRMVDDVAKAVEEHYDNKVYSR